MAFYARLLDTGMHQQQRALVPGRTALLALSAPLPLMFASRRCTFMQVMQGSMTAWHFSSRQTEVRVLMLHAILLLHEAASILVLSSLCYQHQLECTGNGRGHRHQLLSPTEPD